MLAGSPIAKILEADPNSEVAVFGGAWINALIRQYVKAVKDMENFERGKGFRVTKATVMNAVMLDPAPFSRRHILIRALLVWLILIAAEFVHGTLRAIFLVPYHGALLRATKYCQQLPDGAAPTVSMPGRLESAPCRERPWRCGGSIAGARRICLRGGAAFRDGAKSGSGRGGWRGSLSMEELPPNLSDRQTGPSRWPGSPT